MTAVASCQQDRRGRQQTQTFWGIIIEACSPRHETFWSLAKKPLVNIFTAEVVSNSMQRRCLGLLNSQNPILNTIIIYQTTLLKCGDSAYSNPYIVRDTPDWPPSNARPG